MASSTENLLNGVKAQFTAWFSDITKWNNGTVGVDRNISVPAEIPAGGQIILRDGKIVDKTYIIGSRSVFYSREIEIEVYFENPDETVRDAGYDLLTVAIGAALESDTTIGGTANGCLYDRDNQDIHPIDGGAGIKCATLKPVFDYTASTPLS